MARNRGTLAIPFQTLMSERGVALLMVLWILTILMVLVLSFTFVTRTETHATLSFKEGAEKRFLAEAGVNRGIMEIYYRDFYKKQAATEEASQVAKVDGTRYLGRMGTDYYIYSIFDESGKLNINLLNDASGIILNNLLVKKGVPKEQADTILDSILDWRDADESHRTHGAESDYYMTLPNPYKARNAKFETVEELLLVKGMTPEILYGGGKTGSGIINVLTIYGTASQINVNTASRELIEALPGMTRELTDQVFILRNSGEMKDAGGISAALGEAYKTIAPYVNQSVSSTYYTIESAGFKGGGNQGLEVKAVMEIQGGGKPRCLYYKSPAGIRQLQAAAPATGTVK